MKLIVLGKTTQVNQYADVDEIFELIYAALAESGKIINAMIIDGVQVNNNFEQYMQANIGIMEELIVVESSKYALALDNIRAIQKYLEEMIPEMRQLGVDFKKEVTKEVWESFEMSISGLIFVSGAMGDIMTTLLDDEAQRLVLPWSNIMNEYNQLSECLTAIEDLLDAEETVKCGEIIEAEMMPILENTLLQIKKETMLLR